MTEKREYKDGTNVTSATTNTLDEHQREAPITVERAVLDLIYTLNYQQLAALDVRLRTVTDALLVEWQKSTNRDKLIAALRACFTEFVNNTPLYALLVALINAESAEFGVAIVEMLQDSLEEYLADGSWKKIKAITRMLGELVNVHVISASDLSEVYKSFLTVLSNAFAKQERKDVFASIVLHGLAWHGSMLDAQIAAGLLQSIEKYVASGREERKMASFACRILGDAAPYEQPDDLTLLFKQVSVHCAAGWKTTVIIRPSTTLLDISRETSMVLQARASQRLTDKLPFGPIKVPMENPSLNYPSPTTHFEVFHKSILTTKGKVEIKLPETESIERCLMYDICADLIHNFNTNHRELIRYLDENLYFSDATPFNTHQILMEILVKNILRLPYPEHRTIYYAVIIMDLCRQYPKIIPPILGKAFYTLFDNLELLDPECQSRFSNWFSIHISNFDFKWNWKEWMPALQPDRETLKSIFVKEVLENCVRLSYFERVQKSFPQDVDLNPWMPTQPQPRFKFHKNTEYGQEHPETVRLSHELMDLMKRKFVDAEKEKLLAEVQQLGVKMEMSREGEPAGFAFVREMVVQCVLILGSKSFSHILNSVERHIGMLQKVNATPESQLDIVKIVAEFWVDNKHFLIITLDKLVTYKVIEPSTVVTWIFAKDGAQSDFERDYVWSLLKTTVVKLNARIDLVSEKLQKARQEAAQMDTEEAEPVEEGMEVDELTTDEVAKLQGTLDNLKREQKHLFISIFQNFMDVLKTSAAPESPWYTWTLGMMKEFGRHFHKEVKGFATTLDMMVFVNADEKFKALFQQLRNIHA